MASAIAFLCAGVSCFFNSGKRALRAASVVRRARTPLFKIANLSSGVKRLRIGASLGPAGFLLGPLTIF